MAGDGGENIAGAGAGCPPRPRQFATRMQHAAIADRRQQGGKVDLDAQYAGGQIGLGDHHRLARAEHHFRKGGDIVAQRHLVIGGAVEVIESGIRQALSRGGPQISDIDDMGTGEGF